MTRALLRPRIVAPVAVIAVAAAGGTVYARRDTASAQYRTAAATLGTVTQTIALSGNLTPANETDLDFAVAGRVASVPVQAGQAVTAGQVLAALDTTSLQATLTQAQATLQSAQAKLSLDQAGPTAQNLAQANAAIASAQVALATATTSLADTQAINQQSIQQAQAALTAAQNTVAADQSVLDADSAKLQHDQSTEQTDCGTSPPAASCSQDQQTVQSDQQKVATDQQTLTRDQGTATSAQSSLAATQVKAQQSDDQAQGQLRSAQVALQNAQASLAALEQGATPQQIQMDQSQVAIDQVAVDNAQRSLTEASLVAPVAGVVGQLNLTVGQSVSGSTGAGSTGASSSGSSSSGSSSSGSSSSSSSTSHAVAILTPGAFQVTGTVSDAQVDQVAVGQRARVTAAGSTEAVDGRVSFVSPEATITSGVATFPVTVTLDGSNPSLHAGQSASIGVIVNQVVQVLTVPTGAVHTGGAGSTVDVLANGTPSTVPVTVGASDPLRTQILSGLKAGDQVVIATVSSAVPTAPARGAGGALFGGGGGGGRTFGGGGGGGG